MAPALILPSPPELGHFRPEPIQTLHILELPGLYTKPSAIIILKSLVHLTLLPPSWDEPPADTPVAPPGPTKWLTSIIASPLHWIADEETKEQIWNSASARLAERCGRTAMPSTTRTFRIPLPSETLELTIHEPTLTADNLGLKTWASSYLLSKRLLQLPLPHFAPGARILELGSGTGLVGLSAAGTWDVPVLLTDLPEIVPNLRRNVDANRAILKSKVDVAVLDWRDDAGGRKECEKFDVILAADPIYSPEHPALVAGMVDVWMKKGPQARAVVEIPLRDGFGREREGFKECMSAKGLVVLEQGVETGFDDWGNGEVQCWWSVWGWGREMSDLIQTFPIESVEPVD